MERRAITTTWRRSFAIVVVVSLATLVGCAGRRPAEEAPSRQPPVATPIPVATPAPTPTPTPVPPSLACTTAADCTLTPYPRPVTHAAGCYCPSCPQPRNAAAAAANEESWQRLCGGAWAERAACEAPMCTRPIAPVCESGACRTAVSDPAAGVPPG